MRLIVRDHVIGARRPGQEPRPTAPTHQAAGILTPMGFEYADLPRWEFSVVEVSLGC